MRISIGSPKLRLIADQDRSVVLEIEFHGENVQHAYRYLSESQLNSFGLAVFLASAMHFNTECPFLILDDVVNSFDAYKRPRLVEIFKRHLGCCQVLLLTHDRFWQELLSRNLPTWKGVKFFGYEYGVGPIVSQWKGALEQVREALKQDEPEKAGQALAQHMENVVQEICEAFQVEVSFTRRNEYTLDPLLNRLTKRLGEKLGPNDSLTQAVDRLCQDNAYRNWCIHCKNPDAPIQASEIQQVLDQWVSIEKATHCQDTDCADVLKYDASGNRFRCECGKTELRKPKPAPVTP